jgi:uncharacterized membrane protein (UPF0136 family)
LLGASPSPLPFAAQTSLDPVVLRHGTAPDGRFQNRSAPTVFLTSSEPPGTATVQVCSALILTADDRAVSVCERLYRRTVRVGRDGTLLDHDTYLRAWSDLLVQVQNIWAQQPVLFVFVIPCVLAVMVRSLTALLISGLLAAAGLVLLGTSLDEIHQWGVAAALCLSGVLAAVQSFRLRRTRRRLRRVDAEVARVTAELKEVQDRYHDEVRWRKAIASFAVATKRNPQLADRVGPKPSNVAHG